MSIINDEEKLFVRSREVNVLEDNKRLRDSILKLKDAIRENNLTAVSSVQIGDEWEWEDKFQEQTSKSYAPPRIFCIKFGDKIRTFIDPIISSAKGLSLSRETCHCFPNREFIRVRNNDIVLTYFTPMNKVESTHLVGKAAFVAQHQIDHLEGITLPELGLEIFDDFDQATDEERQQIIDAYLDSLDLRLKEFHKEVETDKDLQDMSNAIDFLTKVQRGEIELTREKVGKIG